ncbi:MAG TPA: tRNA dihydrouridine(20/20a) synthase DusA, partial [Steroidobacteraceae bacterium]|nr:tRNA dihydrouridine(20/20a) synthase DusA [Steroidobacteraceae bacterium]
VAPMMDWTDRHCRYLHRLYAPHALLYTEMIVSAAIVRGNAQRLLAHDPLEQPLALQLGGSDPRELEAAARIGEAAGFAEINLNVGCPSDRVQRGAFGACLMLRPELVAECVTRMRAAVVSVPITVKCRIGVDERDDYQFLSDFAGAVVQAGVQALIVHARAAILRGLSPKQNREIPPLNYPHVQRLKREHPQLPIVLNGGMSDVASVSAQLAAGLDGVMLGRAAYHRPALLAELERSVLDGAWRIPEPCDIIERLVPYARAQIRQGVRLHSITRHLHGLMAGRAGARAWRRYLSEVASRSDAAAESLLSALSSLEQGAAA